MTSRIMLIRQFFRGTGQTEKKGKKEKKEKEKRGRRRRRPGRHIYIIKDLILRASLLKLSP